MKPLLSIIVPVFNESRLLARALSSAQTGPRVDLIVVDGGSQDESLHVAESFGARILTAPRGRAGQMNAGAYAASGEILLFLHADTQLPSDFEQTIAGALSKPGIVAGAFELGIDARQPGLRIIEQTANWRARHFQMPYGDQALFMRAAQFRALEGFKNMSIMEDFELVLRLRQRGRIVIVPAAVTTSGQRWNRLGILRTTLVNQVIVVCYLLGVSPSRLSRWYE